MLRWIIVAIGGLIFLALVFGTRTFTADRVFIDGQVYYVEADSYARMNRVSHVAAHPGTILREHGFENWPEGTRPHTTMPFDWVVAALVWTLRPWLSFDAQDLAGAWIGPVLALATAVALFAWAVWGRRPGVGWIGLLLWAGSPALVWANVLGRPDHQALLIPLLTVAFAAGIAGSTRDTGAGSSGGSRVWPIVAGLAWGLACWVSLYEPPILLAIWLVTGWISGGRAPVRWAQWRAGLFTFGAVAALALWIEGPRFDPPWAHEAFGRWRLLVPELAGASGGVIVGWVGWLGLCVPAWLAIAWWRGRDRQAGAWVLRLVCVTLLTLWQARWGAYLALVAAFAWLIAAAAPAEGMSWPRARGWARAGVWIGCAAALLLGVWPVLRHWETMLYPEGPARTRRMQETDANRSLRHMAARIDSGEHGGILAPYWLSPALAYWSAVPAVGGTSHGALDGIVDSTRFFCEERWDAARALLDRRRVRWVLSEDAARLGAVGDVLLGAEAGSRVAQVLQGPPRRVPTFLELVAGSPFHRLYRYRDGESGGGTGTLTPGARRR